MPVCGGVTALRQRASSGACQDGTVSRLQYVYDQGDPRVSDYFALTDVALRRKLEAPLGLFMAESLEVIGRAIDAGYEPRSFLILEQWLPSVVVWADRFDAPVFVADEATLASIVGFHLHRGALAAMNRKPLASVADVIDNATTVVVIEDAVDHTNVGAIFRSVSALGADAVLVTPRCADPLYRRAVRVSMGTVFQVPWTRTETWPGTRDALHDRGLRIVGMGFGDDAVDIRTVNDGGGVALVVGTERSGLSRGALGAVDVVATIPMRNGVDSLNVASAAAVGLWELVRGNS